MDFRRNGLRDERRRRVLIDETLHGESADASTAAVQPEAARAPVKSYSDAAIASSQLPVTTFLPKHPFITWTVWTIGLAIIAGIELLYQYGYRQAPDELRGSLAALDVHARGSLSSWFATVVLGVSAFGSLLVFQIRRHRTDDYRGRYRWWLWLVPLLLGLSVDVSTGLHEALSGVLTSASGASFAVGGKGWWMLAYAAVFFPVILQLVIEVWPSRLATFFLFLTTAEYVVAAAFELSAVELPHPEATGLWHSAVLLSAHLGVLVTILAYGRYVYLDAHERLAPRRIWFRWPKFRRGEKKKKAKPAAAVKPAGKQVRLDEPHARFGQDQATPPTVTIKAHESEDQGDDASDQGDRRLSKSERRRQRKEAQRLQRS
jgi:hypothetical protein